MTEFVKRTCPACGEPQNEDRDGKEFILRCTCDWERGFLHRLRRTIHPTFWAHGMKRMVDWRPPVFSSENKGIQRLMDSMKILAIRGVYDFCYKEVGKRGGVPVHALLRNISCGNNLFIRGPKGSGRGLLVATIKLFAAARDVSATPMTGDWSILRGELSESESFGTGGEAARANILENYGSVDLMTLENVRSEGQVNLAGNKILKKVKGSTMLDMVLAKRMSRQGSVVMSSFDFAGQIQDTIGDQVQEMLSDDKTSMILLFSASEMKTIKESLQARRRMFRDMVTEMSMSKDASGSGSLKDKEAARPDSVRLLDAFYFQEVFGNVVEFPQKNDKGNVVVTAEDSTCRDLLGKEGLAEKLSMSCVKIKVAIEEYRKIKDSDPMAHQENRSSAAVAAMMGCKSMCEKMSRREMIEAARMFERSSNDKLFSVARDEAIKLKKFMSGVKEEASK